MALKSEYTRIKILDAAKELFLKKGFAGTSISAVAKKANTAKSLIFHHFESKDALWVETKKHINNTNNIPPAPSWSKGETLETYLRKVVKHRVDMYFNNSDLRRFMNWQRVEPDNTQLLGKTKASPDSWVSSFKAMQKEGLIKEEVDVKVAIIHLANAVNGLYSDQYTYFKNNADKKAVYLEMIVTLNKAWLQP